jgi:hypothetical protein
MIAFAALVLVESLAVDLLILSQLRMHWSSEARLAQAKKNPAFAGSSSFTERSILLLSFSFFSAPHL